mgnify:CR=1 FL=1
MILLLHVFESNVIEFLYLVNDEYAPHDKWLMKEAESLKKGREILNEHFFTDNSETNTGYAVPGMDHCFL